MNSINKNMQKYSLVIIFLISLFLNQNTFSQNYAQANTYYNLIGYDQKPLHFGFVLGSDYTFYQNTLSKTFLSPSYSVYSIDYKAKPGFYIGPLVNFRLNKFFDFRLMTILLFNNTEFTFITKDQNPNNGKTIWKNNIFELSNIYITFPILLKLKARRKANLRPFLVAGLEPSINLTPLSKISDSKDSKWYQEKYNIYLSAGFGVDFYLDYFKFSVEIKYTKGLRNEIDPNYHKNKTILESSLEAMKSSILWITFSFE